MQAMYRVKLANPRVAYIAPQRNQAKSVAWEYCKQMSRTLPAVEINESELRIDFAAQQGRARLQLWGADSIDTLRGNYFDAVVLDEAAQMQANLWPQVIRPALSERAGTGTFIGTPQGHGAFYNRYITAQADPDWYTAMFKASETGYISDEELEGIQRDLTAAEYAQEFECSFEAAIKGAYYGVQMSEVVDQDRVRNVPHDPSLPTFTAWDLGYNDSTIIVYAQQIAGEIRIIDCDQYNFTALDKIIRDVKAKPYMYADHIAPPDIKVHELSTGRTRLEVAQDLGVNFTVLGRQDVDDGISAVQRMLPRCYFDRDKTWDLTEALKQYRTEYDNVKQVFKTKPLHDHNSDFADAMRYLAVSGVMDRPIWSAAPLDYTSRDKGVF